MWFSHLVIIETRLLSEAKVRVKKRSIKRQKHLYYGGLNIQMNTVAEGERDRERGEGGGGRQRERESLSEPSSRRTAALTVDPLSVWPG